VRDAAVARGSNFRDGRAPHECAFPAVLGENRRGQSIVVPPKAIAVINDPITEHESAALRLAAF
jgi:hypothetical protein